MHNDRDAHATIQALPGDHCDATCSLICVWFGLVILECSRVAFSFSVRFLLSCGSQTTGHASASNVAWNCHVWCALFPGWHQVERRDAYCFCAVVFFELGR